MVSFLIINLITECFDYTDIIYFINYVSPNTGAAALNSFEISKNLAKYGKKLIILALGESSKPLKLDKSSPIENLKNL